MREFSTLALQTDMDAETRTRIINLTHDQLLALLAPKRGGKGWGSLICKLQELGHSGAHFAAHLNDENAICQYIAETLGLTNIRPAIGCILFRMLCKLSTENSLFSRVECDGSDTKRRKLAHVPMNSNTVAMTVHKKDLAHNLSEDVKLNRE